MLPLRDNIPSRSFPFVNTTLIALNVLAFIYQLSLGEHLGGFVRTMGVVPVRFTDGVSSSELPPLLTSMFLHGGWMHLIGNMLFLWIFGDNVEDRLGHGRYLIFYLLGGIGASLVHIFLNPQSPVPTIGASGAISAVLAGYVMLYPKARIETLVLFFYALNVVEIPALLYIGVWFVEQFFAGVASLPFARAAVGGVAYWAHVGGFVIGLLCVKLFCPPRPKRQSDPNDYIRFE